MRDRNHDLLSIFKVIDRMLLKNIIIMKDNPVEGHTSKSQSISVRPEYRLQHLIALIDPHRTLPIAFALLFAYNVVNILFTARSDRFVDDNQLMSRNVFPSIAQTRL